MSEQDPPEETPTETPAAPLLRLREPLPAVVDTDDGAAPRTVRGHRGRHRSGRDRRRARLRLPLLLARLPDPAAPRGRRHPPGRPDRASTRWRRCRRRSTAPSGSSTPPPRTCPAWPRSGCAPAALFDTELAGRLLGYPRVGLATLVETLLGRRLAKEHSAVDWSTRPLPRAVAGVRRARRRGAGRAARRARRASWSRPARTSGRGRSSTRSAASRRPPASTPWRRTSGVHRVRGRRALGRGPRAVGAARRDRPRARRHPRPDPARLRDRRGRHRDARRPADAAAHPGLPRPRRRALRRAVGRRRCSEVAELPEEELPTRAPRGDGPPLPRAWAEKDPVAARRLTAARDARRPRCPRSIERPGREPAHARPPAPGALDAAGHPRPRAARRGGRRAAARATAPAPGSAR